MSEKIADELHAFIAAAPHKYPGHLIELFDRAEKALRRCSAESAQVLHALQQTRACLEWLDRNGGLGLDVHGHVRTVLADTAPAALCTEPQAARPVDLEAIAELVQSERAAGSGHYDTAQKLLEYFVRCQAESAATTAWECSARKQGTAGGNNPSDCDWPGCGCDPQANKVLEAIDEAGFEIVRKPEIRRMAHPQPQANNALRGFGWRSDCPACVASKMVCDAHGSALMRPQAESEK